MKLAEALVLRKHLEAKVNQLKPIYDAGERGLFENRIERVKVSEEVDEVKLKVPRVDMADVTKEYDKYSKALRQIDTAIQQTNWTADLKGDVDLTDINV